MGNAAVHDGYWDMAITTLGSTTTGSDVWGGSTGCEQEAASPAGAGEWSID